MKAVVLAGGEGTRLRPLTYATPKPLLPIANQPFLEHQLNWLARHGVDEVVLSIGYRPDAFAAHFGADATFGGLRLRYAVEPEPLGTAGGIAFAATAGGWGDDRGGWGDDRGGWGGNRGGWGEGRFSERIVVCNGDVLTDLDLSALVRFHDERGAEATISLTRVDDPSAFGVVPTEADGRVLGFVEKPPPGEAPTDWVNAGTYVLEASVLDGIPTGRPVSIERETFPALLERDGKLYAMASEAYWLDIGTPVKYLQANLDLLAGRDVLLGPGAEVSPTATVSACAVGAGARVGDGASLSRSVLLAGAVVGPGASVVDSVIGAGASVGEGAVVSDVTIVGPGAAVAAGARLAGARVEA